MWVWYTKWRRGVTRRETEMNVRVLKYGKKGEKKRTS